MRSFLFLLASVSLCSCGSCQLAEYAAAGLGIETGQTELILMSFNVQNLFDSVDDGSEYYEYDPGNGYWGIDEYYAKLKAVSSAIRRVNSGRGPDIVALQEIEKRTVLNLLSSEFLPDLGYRFIYAADREGEAVHCGVLSRVPVDEIQCHASSPSGRFIIEVGFRPVVENDGNPFTLFINHWKSKREGVAETEEQRYLAADFLRHRMESVDEPVIICGDLNWDTNKTGSFSEAYGTLPPGVYPAFGPPGSSSPLWLSRRREAVSLTAQLRLFFDPWDVSPVPGSYYWDGEWDAIDHFLLSSRFIDGRGWEFGDFSAEIMPEFCDEYGLPVPFSRNSHAGCSDHLPVLLYLEFL